MINLICNNSTELFTKAEPGTGLGKVIQFPLIRLIIAFLFLTPAPLLAVILNGIAVAEFNNTGQVCASYFINMISVVGLFYLYKAYTGIIEKREARELSFLKFHYELGAGVLAAFVIVSFIVTVLVITGCYKIDEINPFSNVFYMFILQMRVGFVEELIFRVILFKLVEEFAGSWTAILTQGVLFGLGHAANPNATVFTSLALIIFFSFLFGAGYMITRRIWFVMGLHWGWNFFQAGVFGMPNSGINQPGLISPTIAGSEWLTGGAWGIEASVITFVLLFALGLFLLKKVIDRKQLVKAVWNR